MDKKNETIPKEVMLKELELWKDGDIDLHDTRGEYEYETMWQMFRKVIETSSWGTSEFGGPVWIMDFTLDNLRKLFPESPLLDFMENEKEQGFIRPRGMANSLKLATFSEWFAYRARTFIIQQGLGNVILKNEGTWTSNLSFYCWGFVLKALCSAIGGEIILPKDQDMLKYNFSYREKVIVDKLDFLTCLDCSKMVETYPCFIGQATLSMHSDIYGDCYLLQHHNSLPPYTTVIPETINEKILTLIINDLMDDIAIYGRIERHYPLMKYPERPCLHTYGNHFEKSSNMFTWKRNDGKGVEEIKINLPQIDPKHGIFWHKQFPPKQTWQVFRRLKLE